MSGWPKVERRRLQAPSTPGNYPEDYLAKMRYVLEQRALDSEREDLLREIFEPKKHHGVLIAADIRNFTHTLQHNDSKVVTTFVSEFFSEASSIIKECDAHGKFINKFLGDGLFAHLPDAKAESVVDAATELIRIFNGAKKAYKFRFANLSVAITRTDYTVSPIGGHDYTDYTLIGPRVNSLFRLLSRTRGGMVWITEAIKEKVMHSHFTVYLGDLKFKGIVPGVTTFSVIRKKTEDEDVFSAANMCTQDMCANYSLCRRAWEHGQAYRAVDNNQFVFNLNCHECGPDNTQCWLWNDCKPKFEKLQKRESITCCFMCKNYRNCFHSFQLGKQGEPMISCDTELYENFIID